MITMKASEAEPDMYYILLSKKDNNYTIGMKNEDGFWSFFGTDWIMNNEETEEKFEIIMELDIQEYVADESTSR